MAARIAVKKTYKLYIDGKFPRSESNRAFDVKDAEGKHFAHASRGSRKDIRDAVRAARKAQNSWEARSAFNRGQILYRIAEMLEDRRSQFVDEIVAMTGDTKRAADAEVSKAIDRMIWYAGWSDKFTQLFSSINPVAASYWNFTYPTPTGVVGIVAPEEKPLLGLVSKIAPVIVSGNTCVVIASERAPLSGLTFGEVLATSDVPAGVVNIITGFKSELVSHFGTHMDLNAVDYSGNDAKMMAKLQEDGAENVKRIVIRQTPHGEAWLDDSLAQSPYWIESFVEMKTAWHPVGT